MATVRFRHRDSSRETVLAASPAESLLSAILKADLSIRHDCGGKAQCGTCRVRVLSGGSSLSPALDRERERLGAVKAGPDERLACQAHAARETVVQPVLPPAGAKDAEA